jgi:hypothetical protein
MAGGPSGCKESKGKRGNGRGLEWAIYCLNWHPRLEGKRGGRRPGVARFAAAPGRPGGGVRKKKRKGGRERLTGGVAVSARAKKRKRERDGPARGELGGLAGLAGPKGERVRFSLFFFFFKLLFKTAFLFKFKSKLFQTFSQKFINLLETTQATKNHASQLMMHNHLLSLSLLNYV